MSEVTKSEEGWRSDSFLNDLDWFRGCAESKSRRNPSSRSASSSKVEEKSMLFLHHLLHCLFTPLIALPFYTTYCIAFLHHLFHCLFTPLIPLPFYTTYSIAFLHHSFHCLFTPLIPLPFYTTHSPIATHSIADQKSSRVTVTFDVHLYSTMCSAKFQRDY